MSSICSRPLSISVKVVNRKSAARAAKSRPGGEKAAFKVIGRGFCKGRGFARDIVQLVELAVEIEGLVLGVDARQDLEPFEALRVAVVDQIEPEHRELFGVPAANDVEPGPPVRGVVDGRERLGGEHRMRHRHMDGREQGDPLGDAREARREGQGLVRPFAAVELAAEALPAGDRQDELETGLVRHAGDLDDLRPERGPALGNARQSEAAIGVDREDAELEDVRAVHRMHEKPLASWSG